MSATTTRRPPIRITHEGGTCFEARIRSHRLVLDQPLEAHGEDLGPMPLELLGASLGACVALYVQQFCQARAIPTEGMLVEVESFGARNPARIGRFEVNVTLATPVPPEYVELLDRVARSCPAHGTLAHGAEVAIGFRLSDGAAPESEPAALAF